MSLKSDSYIDMNHQATSASYSKIHQADETSGQEEIKALARLVKKALNEQAKLKKEVTSAQNAMEEKMRCMEGSSRAELLERIQTLERQLDEKNESRIQQMEKMMQDRLNAIENEMQVRLILALASCDKAEHQKGDPPTRDEEREDRLGECFSNQLSRLEDLLQELVKKLDKAEVTSEASQAHEGMAIALSQLKALLPWLQRIIKPSSDADVQKAQILFDHTHTLVKVMSEQLNVACASAGSVSKLTTKEEEEATAEDLGGRDQAGDGSSEPVIEEMRIENQNHNRLQERLHKMMEELTR
jgi:hypothetical protein